MSTNPSQLAPQPAPGTFRRPNFLDPDKAETYGLADKFIATVGPIRAVPYDYNRLSREIKARNGQGKALEGRPGYSLCVCVGFTADPGQGLENIEPSYYQAAPLYHFVPSPDGVNPAGATWDTYKLLADGKAQIQLEGATEANPKPYDHAEIMKYGGLFIAPVGGYDLKTGAPANGHSGFDAKGDWMIFLNAMRAIMKSAGVPFDAAGYESRGFAALEGYKGRFDRLPRPGSTDPKKTVLVMTELIAVPGTVGAPIVTAAGNVVTPGTVQGIPPVPTPVQAGADVAINAAKVAASTDPVDIYVRTVLGESGGKVTLTELLTKAKDFPAFAGNQVFITGTVFPKIMVPAQLVAAGFNFNPATSTVSLPGVV